MFWRKKKHKVMKTPGRGFGKGNCLGFFLFGAGPYISFIYFLYIILAQEALKRRQAEQVRHTAENALQNGADTVIVAGDFNSVPGSDPYLVITAGL